MSAARWRDPALLLLALAGLAALVAALDPRLSRVVALRDLVFVVDVTRSMNVRDMDLGEGAISRLDAVRAELPRVIANLPCGSRAGLGVFTERRSLTFIEPVEVCENYVPLSAAIDALDWRMAWEGDSMIVRGLHHALDRARQLDADLVFLTDGHEAPPPPFAGQPAYGDAATPVRGAILGVGGATPMPIPRFDRDGREVGFYRPEDVQQSPRRIGKPPPDAASRPGFHPRNNPYGEADLSGEEHLSTLRGAYLHDLARTSNLGYVAMSEGVSSVASAFARATRSRAEVRKVSVAAFPAGLALAALALGYAARVFMDRRQQGH
ncbi:mxaL protein [Amaricoccus macauensis]|uniref:MxaL protein n=1 Tax=Amaricoccus macauensis TaxID=57001 RepID=A0A840SMY2_9RHOB|nr:vWA domain-containing protein [Amaricoccus macauensis]MBB5221638.1 mxaL protein [Amaricoccus macauensis]